jgi:hypothetical protein
MTRKIKPTIANDGFTTVERGHQPIVVKPTSNEQAGHIPTTSEGGSGPGTPPNQGSGGSKK